MSNPVWSCEACGCQAFMRCMQCRSACDQCDSGKVCTVCRWPSAGYSQPRATALKGQYRIIGATDAFVESKAEFVEKLQEALRSASGEAILNVEERLERLGHSFPGTFYVIVARDMVPSRELVCSHCGKPCMITARGPVPGGLDRPCLECYAAKADAEEGGQGAGV